MIVLLGNQKGGVGKSTLTVNLAVAWQERGKSVIVIEADPSIHTVSNWSDDRAEAGLPPVLAMKRTGRLVEPLQDLNKKYDIVLVDLPGKDSKEMRSALQVADLLVIPAQASQTDIDATIDLFEIVEVATETYNPRLKHIVVLNRVATHVWSTEEQESREALSNTYTSIANTVVHDRKIFRSSLSDGKSVLEGADDKAVEEVLSLTSELEGLLTNGN